MLSLRWFLDKRGVALVEISIENAGREVSTQQTSLEIMLDIPPLDISIFESVKCLKESGELRHDHIGLQF